MSLRTPRSRRSIVMHRAVRRFPHHEPLEERVLLSADPIIVITQGGLVDGISTAWVGQLHQKIDSSLRQVSIAPTFIEPKWDTGVLDLVSMLTGQRAYKIEAAATSLFGDIGARIGNRDIVASGKQDILFIGHGMGAAVNQLVIQSLQDNPSISGKIDVLDEVALDPVVPRRADSSGQRDPANYKKLYPEKLAIVDRLETYYQHQGLLPVQNDWSIVVSTLAETAHGIDPRIEEAVNIAHAILVYKEVIQDNAFRYAEPSPGGDVNVDLSDEKDFPVGDAERWLTLRNLEISLDSWLFPHHMELPHASRSDVARVFQRPMRLPARPRTQPFANDVPRSIARATGKPSERPAPSSVGVRHSALKEALHCRVATSWVSHRLACTRRPDIGRQENAFSHRSQRNSISPPKLGTAHPDAVS